MTDSDFIAELLRERDWRFAEVWRLKNLIDSQQPQDRDDLRKPLILLLYGHFEGFCVFSLQHYVAAVNQKRLVCDTVTPALVAGAWERLFRALDTGDQKSKVFRQTLPNDTRLHRHWRRRHFVESILSLYQLPVELSDDIIDSESNLKAEVLERNLFIIGLDHTFVDPHFENINNLLGRRNRIAHGEDRRGVTESDYMVFENTVGAICKSLIEFLDSAHRDSRFERGERPYVG